MASIEIDEARRELRAGERALSLQPKVFDLLVYLARNRERVVPRDELLRSVWPDIVVTGASLERAVSLARGALAELGAPAAIRTYSRHGYRFCAGEASEALGARTETQQTALGCARDAYSRGSWVEAIALLRGVADIGSLSPEDLRCWVFAAQCLGRPDEALPTLERAVALHSARGQARRAAWAAVLLAQLHVEWSEGALANGWLQRAARLLEAEPACREHGYVEMLRARLALDDNDLARAQEHALAAREAGQLFADPDLEGLSLMFAGQARLFAGQTRAGLDALDEAAAAVRASGLSGWAGALVYCGVIYCYLSRADWSRAAQWTNALTSWCEAQGPTAYPVLCRMHRAEVLWVKGRLLDAVGEITATIELLQVSAPWARLRAWALLGDIQLARGSLTEARAAFQRAAELGWDSTFGLALVRFQEGDAPGALRQLTRNLDEEGFASRSRRGLVLAYVSIIASAAGQPEQARSALATLDGEPELVSAPALSALVARARGELLATEGDHLGAIRSLRSALRSFQALQAPVPRAEVQRALAQVLIAAADLEAAEVELSAAHTTFRQAGADGQLAACEALRQRISALRA